MEKTPGKKALEKAVRGFSAPHGEYFLENRVIAGYNRFGDQFYRTFVGIGAGASAIFLALEVLILIMLGSVYARDRTPEMRLRRAMGASKAKVYGLLTAETLMVGLIGFAFSLLFGFPIAAALNSYLASSSDIYFSLFSIRFVGVAIAFAVTATLSFLSSISPAFSGSKKSLAGALNQGD